MLGKTNITAIEGGTVVTDIEDYSWDKVRIDGVTGTFVKAVYEDDTLVAITKDGTIAYTRDGENWDKTRLDIEGTYELTDIIWDGSRFVIVGSREEVVDQEYVYHGIIIATNDLTDFAITYTDDEYSRYYAVIEKDGKYIVISKGYYGSYKNLGVGALTGQIEDWGTCLADTIILLRKGDTSNSISLTDYCEVIVEKNNRGGVIYVEYYKNPVYSSLYTTTDWSDFNIEQIGNKGTTLSSGDRIQSIFKCKGSFYYIINSSTYNFVKLDIDINRVIWTGINARFTDAVYYDKCEIYLSEYGLVIVRQGEHIKDKTLEDLIEITYDFSMELIVQAFDGLYIFGTGGNILMSNNEIKNEEALAVKTMSALKALYDSKLYTDEIYKKLEARVEALEMASAKGIG